MIESEMETFGHSSAGTKSHAEQVIALAIRLEEWVQQFFPLRTSDWVDWIFSYAGVALGAWIEYRKGKAAV